MRELSYFHKKYFNFIFIEIDKYIPKCIHPNLITVVNFIIIILSNYYKVYNRSYYFSLLILLYWTLDNLDGVHARSTNQTSKIGEILDHCLDGFALPIFFTIGLQYFNIEYSLQKILLTLTLGIFTIKHLINKYTGVLSLGYKYLSISEVCIFGSMLPLIKILNIPMNIINIVVYLYIILCSITLIKDYTSLSQNKIKNKPKMLYQYNNDVLLYIIIFGLPLYVNNIYILSTLLSLYLLYLIKTQKV